MVTIEGKFEEAILASDIPGVVVVAQNKTGSFQYAKAFGPLSLKKEVTGKNMPLNATFFLASATKLLTSIAALQCVERGQFSLDEDVTRLLPELKDISVLTGFEDGGGAPVLRRVTKNITLRHFLTHTSGLAYDIFNPSLQRWRKSRGEEATLFGPSLIHSCTTPLLFEPGEGFDYGTGLEWAGIMVERVNNTSLETYMQKYIFMPLGITNIAFHLAQRPDMLAALTGMNVRLGGTHPYFGTAANPEAKVAHQADEFPPIKAVKEDSGGTGAYASATDYQKVLQSLASDDYKLLGKGAIDELFRQQLGQKSQEALMNKLRIKEINDIIAPGVPMGTQAGYGLGGMLVLEDVQGRRRKGSMNWSGMPNIFWWVDRAVGISGIYASQLIPTGDAKSVGLWVEFETAMYEKAAMGPK